MSPRFSIVVPYFNQGQFLGECLASLEAQTLPPAEVIVVDDGSTDPWAVERARELCRPPVQLVRQQNRGPAGARNAGIALATGDWILPLDADDRLTPDALARYAEAITGAPDVSVWYPDVRQFGIDALTWEPLRFSRWRELWMNLLVSSAAVHRRVFDAGLRWNETNRGGFEDWELWIEALCERGFPARALEAAVFEYRRWGHGRFADARRREPQLVDELQRACAIYRDPVRLLALKRDDAPAFSVAARGPALRAVLTAQTLQDFRIADESDRVARESSLAAFRQHPARWLLISLDEPLLASALRGDRWLLEKLATALTHDPRQLTWLVAPTDASRAYPGTTLEAGGVLAGAVVPLRAFLEGARLPNGGAGLIAELTALCPSPRRFVVGPAIEAPSLSAPPDAGRPAPTLRQRIEGLGRRLSRATREVIGPSAHDRLWHLRGLVGVRDRLTETPALPPPGATDPIAERLTDREHRALLEICKDDPLAPGREPAGALVVMMPWVMLGGADRAVVDLMQGLHELGDPTPRYVVTTADAPMHWADQLKPHVDGFFPLGHLGDVGPAAVTALLERIGAGTLILMNSHAGFQALPSLRRALPSLRVLVQLHCFDHDLATGERRGYPLYASSHFDNLIDGYYTVSQQLADELVSQCYVSPTKVHVAHLGIDLQPFEALRHTVIGSDHLEVLWLGRLTEQKNPLLAVEIARRARQQLGDRVHFTLAGDGELDEAVRREIRRHRLQPTVALAGGVPDPKPLYRAADCLLLTSRFEGIPVVVYEAMAAGVPIITPTAESAIAEVLDDESAWLIRRSGDADEFVRVLSGLLADPAAARRRAARAMERVGAHSRIAYADRMRAVWGPSGALGRQGSRT